MLTLCHVVLYRSVAVLPAESEAERDMIRRARIKNRDLSVTGFLHREYDVYYQWFEGPGEKINDLMTVITADPRHSGVDILHRAANQPRRFADWAMGHSTTEHTSLFDWASQANVSLRRINPVQILDFLTRQAESQRAASQT
ncbi:BLUF domain-containing protein [Paracoccus sp. (in: a-proteobacteria)]|uniref:BLUF domain-containing protein n=1 Tax=Paracoccus sp. TaxID=267 RepID=UPI0026DF14A4|nr:BLUF domain-containing protein [Paracoccus sp. (in: a-proteobacteria)]MDO5647335.1 BLUF domain-containing protein [Paracoccus sp. (in: a-proteobacteria)]